MTDVAPAWSSDKAEGKPNKKVSKKDWPRSVLHRYYVPERPTKWREIKGLLIRV